MQRFNLFDSLRNLAGRRSYRSHVQTAHDVSAVTPERESTRRRFPGARLLAGFAVLVVAAGLGASTGGFTTASAAFPREPSGPGSIMFNPSGLSAGQSLQSPSGVFLLSMQGDGNLVLYEAGAGSGFTALWSSGTWGHAGASVYMQSDGNLVVYAPGASGQALWNSGTWGHPITPYSRYFLAVQDDGNVVIYDAFPLRHPLWSTGTGGHQYPLWPNGTGGQQYPYWFTAPTLCNHTFRIDSPTLAWDPTAQVEVSRSYTFGYWNGHCAYKLSPTIGIDINTLHVVGPAFDFPVHWDVLGAAAHSTSMCWGFTGGYGGINWPTYLLPYRAAVAAWCGAFGAWNYVFN